MHSPSPVYTPLMHRLQGVSVASLRLGCFLLALAVYALAGSPTPDHPGGAEVAIGLLLALAAGPAMLETGPEIWRGPARVLLAFGLSVPLATGVLHGNPPGLMVRDVLPFLFLLLPLFMAPLCRGRMFPVLAGVLGVGICFALRSVAETTTGGGGELTYLANMPTVLFAALFCAGAGGRAFLQRFTTRSFIMLLACGGLALAAILPEVLSAQRASLGYAALYGTAMLACAFYRFPYRALVLAVLAGLVLWPLASFIGEAAQVLARKEALVGLNMRAEELAAVWNQVAATPGSLLFGQGWGASFESPAVAGIRVNFTHSLLSSLLLKAGMTGFILGFLYVGALFYTLWTAIRRDPVLGLALAGPALIDVFLYASFKSLDFGLILLLIALAAPPPRKVA